MKSFPNCIDTAIDVWERFINSITHFSEQVITYSCWDQSYAYDLVNIGSSNSVLPGSTYQLPEPVLINLWGFLYTFEASFTNML